MINKWPKGKLPISRIQVQLQVIDIQSYKGIHLNITQMHLQNADIHINNKANILTYGTAFIAMHIRYMYLYTSCPFLLHIGVVTLFACRCHHLPLLLVLLCGFCDDVDSSFGSLLVTLWFSLFFDTDWPGLVHFLGFKVDRASSSVYYHILLIFKLAALTVSSRQIILVLHKIGFVFIFGSQS